MNFFETSFFAPGITSMLAAVLLVATKGWHGKYSTDSQVGVQKFHMAPTPRIGGISIAAGLAAALLLTPGSASPLLGQLLIAGLPAFAAGLAEDFTKKVGVRTRLIATMSSALLAYFLTGYTLTHLELPGIDPWFASLPLSLSFTIFAVAGVANAVNIIDGFNGLAGGTLVICFSALGMIAAHAGDFQLAHLCAITAIVVAGFLVVNFPFGKLFLGDGGAYLLGFLLAWIAVMLPMRNPRVSVWAPLLVCGYPVIETIFSIFRRMITCCHPGHADCSHCHSLIKIGIVRRHFSSLPQFLRNSMVSPFCWSFALVTAGLGIAFNDRTDLLAVSLLGCFALYSMFYFFLVWKLHKPLLQSGVTLDKQLQPAGNPEPDASALAYPPRPAARLNKVGGSLAMQSFRRQTEQAAPVLTE